MKIKNNMSLKFEMYKNQKRQEKEVQKNYDFLIPSYVLSEIRKESENVFALINLAILNGRISRENADILKKNLKERFVKNGRNI